jgi:hypothetical protein
VLAHETLCHIQCSFPNLRIRSGTENLVKITVVRTPAPGVTASSFAEPLKGWAMSMERSPGTSCANMVSVRYVAPGYAVSSCILLCKLESPKLYLGQQWRDCDTNSDDKPSKDIGGDASRRFECSNQIRVIQHVGVQPSSEPESVLVWRKVVKGSL